MTVAMLLTILSALGTMGTLAKNIVDIRDELSKRPPGETAPAESVAAVKAAMGSGGSVWDETHAPEGG